MAKNYVGDIQLINLPIVAKNGTKSLRDCWWCQAPLNKICHFLSLNVNVTWNSHPNFESGNKWRFWTPPTTGLLHPSSKGCTLGKCRRTWWFTTGHCPDFTESSEAMTLIYIDPKFYKGGPPRIYIFTKVIFQYVPMFFSMIEGDFPKKHHGNFMTFHPLSPRHRRHPRCNPSGSPCSRDPKGLPVAWSSKVSSDLFPKGQVGVFQIMDDPFVLSSQVMISNVCVFFGIIQWYWVSKKMDQK